MAPNWFKRKLRRARLENENYAFLFEPPPADEVVSIDCETTGLDRRKDDVISIAALIIRGDRILTSQRFETKVRPTVGIKAAAIKVHRLREKDVAGARPITDVLPELLRFIGSRPLVGYYIDFDAAMIGKHARLLLGVDLPNPRVEVSGLYYELKYSDAPPGAQVDLSFAAILADLGLPLVDQHDAYSDALMTAMIYLILRDLKARAIRIPRQRGRPIAHYGGG